MNLIRLSMKLYLTYRIVSHSPVKIRHLFSVSFNDNLNDTLNTSLDDIQILEIDELDHAQTINGHRYLFLQILQKKYTESVRDINVDDPGYRIIGSFPTYVPDCLIDQMVIGVYYDFDKLPNVGSSWNRKDRDSYWTGRMDYAIDLDQLNNNYTDQFIRNIKFMRYTINDDFYYLISSQYRSCFELAFPLSGQSLDSHQNELIKLLQNLDILKTEKELTTLPKIRQYLKDCKKKRQQMVINYRNECWRLTNSIKRVKNIRQRMLQTSSKK